MITKKLKAKESYIDIITEVVAFASRAFAFYYPLPALLMLAIALFAEPLDI